MATEFNFTTPVLELLEKAELLVTKRGRKSISTADLMAAIAINQPVAIDNIMTNEFGDGWAKQIKNSLFDREYYEPVNPISEAIRKVITDAPVPKDDYRERRDELAIAYSKIYFAEYAKNLKNSVWKNIDYKDIAIGSMRMANTMLSILSETRK